MQHCNTILESKCTSLHRNQSLNERCIRNSRCIIFEMLYYVIIFSCLWSFILTNFVLRKTCRELLSIINSNNHFSTWYHIPEKFIIDNEWIKFGTLPFWSKQITSYLLSASTYYYINIFIDFKLLFCSYHLPRPQSVPVSLIKTASSYKDNIFFIC